MKTIRLVFVLVLVSVAAFSASGYRLVNKIPIPGISSWDYISVDSVNRRIYVSHGTQVEVLDADSGRIIGNIPAPTVDSSNRPVQQQTHGAGIAPDLGRGFTSNGRAGSMTLFDLKTLKMLGEVPVGEGPDGFLYDPATRRAFTFSARTMTATAVDAAKGKVVGSVDLGGEPEAAVADGKGHVFVVIQDKDVLVKFDSRKLAVNETWPVKPCHLPTSMAIDPASQRLFIGCRDKQFVVANAGNGQIITTLPIGGATDGAAFDPKTHLIFVANGEGTVTVIQEESPDMYSVVENVKTEPGARTIALDLKTHKLFLPTSDRTTAISAAGAPPAAPANVPGTFRVLVVGRE